MFRVFRSDKGEAYGLFANFEPYDVQATRREAREKGREEGRAEGKLGEMENGIRRLVLVNKKHGCTRDETREDLMEQYLLEESAAAEKVELYW